MINKQRETTRLFLKALCLQQHQLQQIVDFDNGSAKKEIRKYFRQSRKDFILYL